MPCTSGTSPYSRSAGLYTMTLTIVLRASLAPGVSLCATTRPGFVSSAQAASPV